VHWWDNVLYDTCSLVSLYEVNSVFPGFAKHFPSILTIEETLDRDRLDPKKGAFFRDRVTLVETPKTESLVETVVKSKLSKSLSKVDAILYATALLTKTKVVTGDARLAKALEKKGLLAGNMTLALRTLVLEGEISESVCADILTDLAEKGEFLLNPNKSQNWEFLKDYRFP